MTYTSDEEIAAIGAALVARSLPKEAWTHAAHFAAAMWLLAERGDEAFRDMPDLIRAYNASVGGRNTDTEGYHETITRASLIMARACARERAELALFERVNALLSGPCGRSGWILAHWSRERLFSVAARRGWVEPDLAPLPE